MRLTSLFLLFGLGFAAAAPQVPETVAWRNGAWLAASRRAPVELDVLKRHGVKIAIDSDEFRSTSVPEALAIARAGLMIPAEALQALKGDHSSRDLPAASPVRARPRRASELHCVRAQPAGDLDSITSVSLRVKEGRELNLVR
jgi:hypothetical protein